MSDSKNLFPEFPELTKEKSLDKLHADLRGKAFETLRWHPAENISSDPVYFKEDLPKNIALPSRESNNWWIGESFPYADPAQMNKSLLKSLLHGVESPSIVVDELDKEQVSIVFNGVETAYIQPFLYGQPTALARFAKDFQQYHLTQNKDTSNLQGAFCFSYHKNQLAPIRNGIHKVRANFPSYQFLQIENDDVENDPVKSLSGLVKKAISALENLQEEGLDINTLSKGLFFSLKIGKAYFVEIARLRALQLLWGNIQQSFGIEQAQKAVISVQFTSASQGADMYDNMISATTQAMSAVIGGCQRLTISPADAATEKGTDFTRRIARNVQHMLKMESFLDRVADPAAGSYFLDRLTVELAEQVWGEL